MLKTLPSRPDLRHLKHQAKQLLKALRQGDAHAVLRMKDAPKDMSVSYTLRDAQQVVAREYGYSSWQRLKEAVASPSPGFAGERWTIQERMTGLHFVALDGNIGCMANGAGLAMATMDHVRYYGGEPANFLDLGGGGSSDAVYGALDLIITRLDVRVILCNIFGGIVRCDDIAHGVTVALDRLKDHMPDVLNIPIIVRLSGTNETEGRRMLADTGITVYASMDEAVRQAVTLSR